MAAEWSEAPIAMVHMVQRLIKAYHRGLLDARIGLLMRTEPSKSQGQDVYAKAEKIDGKHAALLELRAGERLDFLVWVAEPFWQSLDDRRREALLDHELSHCDFSTGVPKIVGHDFEDFAQIIMRHGFWNRGLFGAREAFEQAVLIDIRGPGGVVAVKTFEGVLSDG